VSSLGGTAHQAIIERVIAHYIDDARIRAVAVFGSVSTGGWHELSDIDLDIVITDRAAIDPPAEVAALFGHAAAITLTDADSADIVLDTLEEISVRWHPPRSTSPNIAATVRVRHGDLSDAELAAAGEANRVPADTEALLGALVRDAIGARKAICRGRGWEACAAIDRMRQSVARIRGARDKLRLDPADPLRALEQVLGYADDACDLGNRGRGLLGKLRFAAAGWSPPATPS